MFKICRSKDCDFKNIPQLVENFSKDRTSKDGLQHYCKLCRKKHRDIQYHKQYNEQHKDELIEYSKKWREENVEYKREQDRLWRLNNSERKKKNDREYNQTHKEQRNARARQRRRSDPEFKIRTNLRKRIGELVSGKIKTGSAIADLCISIQQLKEYFQSKFYVNPKTGEQMSWENYGKKGWHIDHIIPLSSFDLTNPEQFKKACHYTNLQPMWWFENLSKGDRF